MTAAGQELSFRQDQRATAIGRYRRRTHSQKKIRRRQAFAGILPWQHFRLFQHWVMVAALLRRQIGSAPSQEENEPWTILLDLMSRWKRRAYVSLIGTVWSFHEAKCHLRRLTSKLRWPERRPVGKLCSKPGEWPQCFIMV